MMGTLFRNVQIVNEGRTFHGFCYVENGMIERIGEGDIDIEGAEVIDGAGKTLIPGIIDDQVHFRQPGLTHKADIYTESRAAAAGGITSFMEMPNTNPQTVTQELLEEKYQMGAESSLVNYSFYMGSTNDNLEEVLKTDPETVCGVKIFMGSSTGNMLVDDEATLAAVFENCKLLIATHCEEESVVRENLALQQAKYGDDIPIELHPVIRNHEACVKSSTKAIELAKKYDTRLHILHISTAQEAQLFEASTDFQSKRITAEACVHHLWFTDEDYAKYGSRIKWNPAVKSAADRDAVWEAVLSDRIDVIATDHAPHTIEEKDNVYTKAPSGGPLVQHSLVSMLEHVRNGRISLEETVRKMCHAVADLFEIDRRGYLREGYYADLVLLDLNDPWTVSKENILYKCGWSPFEGTEFSGRVVGTWVNGEKVWDGTNVVEANAAQRLRFNR